jgi:hypothetical protein
LPHNPLIGVSKEHTQQRRNTQSLAASVQHLCKRLKINVEATFQLASFLHCNRRRNEMDFQVDTRDIYRVEVSGWDATENFFVEKTVLNWSDEERKEIMLRSSLREGCVVFMRLLQPMNNGTNFPLPYQAVRVLSKDANGQSRVRLAQLRPRESTGGQIVQAGDPTTRVA